MSVHQMTAIQRDLLFVLNGMEKPHGQDIKDELKRSQDRSLNDARVYTNLNELAERDLLAKGKKDGRTKEYELTEEGRQQLYARIKWERQYVHH